MKEIIDVQVGEVRVEQRGVILQSKAIGSCVAIVAYDAANGVGAIAHVMLPGKASADKKDESKTKYAVDAVDSMISQMARLGSGDGNIEIVLVGGGNVLNREDDTICRDNIESVLRVLGQRQLRIKAQAIGGTGRRSVCLNVERGVVSYSEGNGSEMQLWRAKTA